MSFVVSGGTTSTVGSSDTLNLLNTAGEFRTISILSGYGYLAPTLADYNAGIGLIRLDEKERNSEIKFDVANYIFKSGGHQCVLNISDAHTGSFGSGGGGGGGAVTIANGADVTQGAIANVAWDTVAATATVVQILKRIAIKGTAQPIMNSFVAVGGTPETVAANVLRKGFEIVSLEPIGGADLWIQYGGVAGINAGYPIYPGGSFSTKENAIYPGTISIFSALTGAQFAYTEII